MMGKHLSRRTILRGSGAAIGLPFLDAMAPAFGAGRKDALKPVFRLGFAYVPNGIDMRHWTPAAEGPLAEFPKTLEPMAPYKDGLLLLSGLTHNGGRALGDGPGDHARAAASFLTGVHPRKTAGADILNGVSVDQAAARHVGGQTRFASLELGCEDGRQVGNCDSGYSCAYSNSISWRTPTAPNPPEINPRQVFERLFGGEDAAEAPAERARRQRYQKSVLDYVREDTARLQGDLGPTDRRKLGEYLDGIREIERRIETAEKEAAELGVPPLDRPDGIPVDYANHCRLMFDLMLAAFQADLTRVATFMLAREGSGRAYREIGISDAHHPLTHHRGNQDMLDKVARINRYHMEQFAYFVGRLREARDGDGTLLDRVAIVYGSGLADGNRHTHHDLPVLIAGRAGGLLKTGRHVRYAAETPMANLFLALLDRMGVPAEKLGDSTGKLDYLSDL